MASGLDLCHGYKSRPDAIRGSVQSSGARLLISCSACHSCWLIYIGTEGLSLLTETKEIIKKSFTRTGEKSAKNEYVGIFGSLK